jgi:NADH-quinone oxidoreductase subunit G
MHTSDANAFELYDGDRIEIETDSGKFEAKLKVVESMAAGVLVIPRHRKLSWQIFKAGASIGRDQINKVTT